MSDHAINIVVTDDHPLFRLGVSSMLEKIPRINKIYEAGDGSELLRMLRSQTIELVFLDIEMPNASGIEAMKSIHIEFPAVKVIALTMSSNSRYITEMYYNKVNGYLLKNTSISELTRCVELVMEGLQYFSPEVANKLYKGLNETSESPVGNIPSDLTTRKTEILKYIAGQFSSMEIADHLNISETTVKSYRQSLMQKTGAKNVVGLALYAIKHDIFKI